MNQGSLANVTFKTPEIGEHQVMGALSQGRKGLVLKFFSFLLIPFLTCGCLTTRKAKAPAFRGLTAKEARQMESRSDPSWEDAKPLHPEKTESPEDLAELAEMSLQNGDYESSLLNYRKILLTDPGRLDIRYKLGLTLLLSGKLDEAKKEFAEVLLQKPDMLEAHEALGALHLQENNLPEARREFGAVLALDPKRFQSRYLLGETCLRANQFSQALTEFKTALELSPRNAKVMSALGWTCFKLKNSDQGLEWLKKAKALNPNDPKLNHRLGMVLASQKKFPEALAAFRQAGDEAQAFNNIGVHYYLEHRYAEAARCFQKALELRPTFYEEAKINLDKALARVQDEGQASQELHGHKTGELSLSKTVIEK
jgi:Flp pilus assembly protein TadD